MATIDMGRKLGVSAPLGEGELGPHLTHVARAEAYLHAKFHLIHLTVWPQYTNVTDRTGQTDRQTDRQRSDSIGRTFLQTVAQNDHAV